MTAQPASLLATRRDKLLLLLLCAVQFLDVVDSSIMNVALPSIRADLGLSTASLQWVVSGYVLGYGGLLLLGGRAADLLGRRRMLMAGAASATRFPRRNRPSNPRPAPPNKRATVMRSPRLGVPAGALNVPGCHRHSSEPLAEVP